MGAARIALLACVAASAVLTVGAAAEERPPLQFAPDEVSLADMGAPPPSSSPATPQEDDREKAPIIGGAKVSPPSSPPPSTATTPPPLPHATPPAAPRPDKHKPKAQPADAAPAPTPTAPPRVTLHAWAPEVANRFGPEETIESAMAEVLAADPRLRFSPLSSLLQPADAAQTALADADRALADAKHAYDEMDLDKARALLQTALKTYQDWMPQLAARAGELTPMRDGWVLMAEVRFFDGNLDGARDALRYAFVVDGTLKWNKALFPAQMKKTVVEARLLYDTLGPGKLVIESDPPGAVVWLNGVRLPDRTPTPAVDVPPGPNYITYARRGYAQMTGVFEAAGGGEEAHALTTLQRWPRNPLAPIDRARAVIDEGPAPPTLKEACARLAVDMLVLVKDARPGERDDEQPATLTAWLYDARADRIINKREMRVEGDLPATARVLARELFTGVRLDGVWAPPKKPRGPRWDQRLWSDAKVEWGRFRGWKYFWYVVGGVAGAAVIGTVAGAAAYGSSRTVASDVVLLGGH